MSPTWGARAQPTAASAHGYGFMCAIRTDDVRHGSAGGCHPWMSAMGGQSAAVHAGDCVHNHQCRASDGVPHSRVSAARSQIAWFVLVSSSVSPASTPASGGAARLSLVSECSSSASRASRASCVLTCLTCPCACPCACASHSAASRRSVATPALSRARMSSVHASVSCWVAVRVAALVSAVMREVSPPSRLAVLTPCRDGAGRVKDGQRHSAADKDCRARAVERRQTTSRPQHHMAGRCSALRLAI